MDWSRAADIFAEALERPDNDQRAFLEEACATDSGMLAELLSMLDARGGSGTLVNQIVSGAAQDLANLQLAGQRIGPYRLIRQIGRGGMGAVYLAERDDDEFRKQVAIKLVRGGIGSGQLFERFRRERQILANLEHPNIARLIDGGTIEDGTPYLVMEYVEGFPILQYTVERGLSLREKLVLFRTVCGAVQFAHQNLVVHRDIKPDNILVAPDGTPKLLDFGIAKLIRPDPAEATLTEANPMTPQYASPEQVRGEPVTTATDVYALGLLLYELVTGERAHRFKDTSALEMARVISDAEPARPMIDGELDTIILHALEKDPRRRYSSAEQLGDDIQRYLEGRPVAARPDTFGYRTRKFVRRHALPVAAAVLLALTLVGGIAATSWQAHVARIERGRAERRFEDVRQLASSFLFQFHSAIEKLPGATPARKLVVREALKYLDRLADESGGDVGLERERAEAYLKISEIQYRPGFSHLGDREGALASARKALEIEQRLTAAGARDGPSRLELAQAHQRVGDIVRFMGQGGQALEQYQKAEALVEGAQDPEMRRTLALLDSRLGDMFVSAGQPRQALEWYQKSEQILQELTARTPRDTVLRRMLGVSYVKLGDVSGNPNMPNLGNVKGAISHYNRAREIAGQLATEDPLNAQFGHDLLVTEDRLGDIFGLAGDFDQALVHHHAAMAAAKRQSEQDPADVGARRSLAVTLGKIGKDQAGKKQYAAALRTFTEVLRLTTKLAESDPGTPLYSADRAEAYQRMAEAALKTANPEAAQTYSAKAAEIRRTLPARVQ